MRLKSDKIYLCWCSLLFFSAFVNGCVQTTSSTLSHDNSLSSISIGQQSNVSMVAGGERIHIKDQLTAEDYVALAGSVTEKMISSAEAKSWRKKGKKPLLVVAVPENTTSDANIITEDIQDEIISRILDSGIARVIDESSLSSSYDYIIKTTITSTTQRGERGSKLTYYTCKLQLFSLRGERLGQWHGTIGLVTAKRGFFF